MSAPGYFWCLRLVIICVYAWLQLIILSTNSSLSFLIAEVEGQQPSKNTKNIPWGPLYCVLQQDEMSFAAYCSEEISVSTELTSFP